MADELKPLISKIGPVSGVRVHQVLGDPHWYSTPTIALEQHAKLKNFSMATYRSQPNKKGGK